MQYIEENEIFFINWRLELKIMPSLRIDDSKEGEKISKKDDEINIQEKLNI